MIGFDPALQNIRGTSQRDNEQDKTKDKKALYESLVRLWYLPPYTSKGMTREYLVQVYHGSVFRVPVMEMKRFELELHPRTLKRTAMQNNGLLVRKLNKLLQSRDQPQLGFDEHEPPEQRWLLSVCMVCIYSDTNIGETFEEAVKTEPPLRQNSSAVSMVHHGRVEACKFLTSQPQVQRSRAMWDSLHTLSDLYRSFVSCGLAVEVLQRQLDEAVAKGTDLQSQLDHQLMRAAITYSSLVNNNISPDALVGAAELSPETKQEVKQNVRL